MTITGAVTRANSDTTSAMAVPVGRKKRVDEILTFVDTQRMERKKYEPIGFGEVETELRKRMLELERELTAEIMVGYDVDAEAIKIAGKAHRPVLRAAQTYVRDHCRRAERVST